MLLTSLESKKPLKEFDIIGFSLQYELSYTTVLNMLHLGGIPIKHEERMNLSGTPLVIAGGPCTVNPLPMSAFIDAFLIGDGEEAVPEILHAYHQWKEGGRDNKTVLLAGPEQNRGCVRPFTRERKTGEPQIYHVHLKTRRFLTALCCRL